MRTTPDIRGIGRRKGILILSISFAAFLLFFELVLQIVERGDPVRHTLGRTKPWSAYAQMWDMYHPVRG